MIGILLLLLFEIMGVTQALIVSKNRTIPVRVWFGMVVGLMEMMWFPTLFAFLFQFSKTAHYMALGLSCAVTVALVLKARFNKKEMIGKSTEGSKTEGSKTEGRKIEGSKTEGRKTEGSKTEGSKTEGRKIEGRKTEGSKTEGRIIEGSKTEGRKIEGSKTEGNKEKENNFPLKTMLVLMIPIALLVGYLQYTHNFRPVDGTLHVGQSTYGDLSMHAAFATGFLERDFPPEYTLLPGVRLGYPFLVDALSGSMLLFGSTLNQAFAIPGTIMIILIFAGFFFFAWEVTRSKAAGILALLLMLFNGGLGFAYTLDRMGETGFAALKEAFNGFYQAPANLVDQNIRWVNFLCDLLIPQRTLMAGWMCLIPAYYMLYTGLKSKRKSDFIALGLFAGPFVMIHTHSFMVLGLISFGVMVDILIREKESRKTNLRNFLLYGGTTCLIAIPQMLIWTLPQSSKSEGFLRVFFNWANNTGSVLRDEYFWFWIKNVGPIFIFLFLAGINAKKREDRAWALGALITFVIAEFILFQPNVYDNNKIFCAAYIAMLPFAAQLLCRIYESMKEVKGRFVLAGVFLFVSMASGAISIAVEAQSDYEIYGKNELAAAEYIKEHTTLDALFLTGQNHNNTVATLAGRNIVCGSSTYLYFHGLDYGQQEADAALMLAYPEKLQNMYEEYGVDYVYVSTYEYGDLYIDEQYVSDETLCTGVYHVNEEELATLYPVVFSADGDWDGIRIYAVSPRAIEQYDRERAAQ